MIRNISRHLPLALTGIIGISMVAWASYDSYNMKQDRRLSDVYMQTAIRKADANVDGRIEPDEALAAYRELGLAPEDILAKIGLYRDSMRLADTNRDGNVDMEEASSAFRTVNEGRDLREDFLRRFAPQSMAVSGSELERYATEQ